MRIRIEDTPEAVEDAIKKIQMVMGPLTVSRQYPTRDGVSVRVWLESPRTPRRSGSKKMPYPTNWPMQYRRWKKGLIKGRDLIESLGISQGTFYTLIKDWEAGIIRPNPSKEGNSPYPENWNELYQQWRRTELNVTEFLKMSGLSRKVFYQLLEEYKPEDNANGDDQN